MSKYEGVKYKIKNPHQPDGSLNPQSFDGGKTLPQLYGKALSRHIHSNNINH